jgi:GNAT superfamily N-acetyltransferase
MDPASGSFSLVMELGDDLVAHVHVFDRQVEIGGGSARCAGIGNVAVSPQQRGKGHAMRLLQECLSRCEAAGFELSLLYTHIPTLYNAVGFETVPDREVLLPPGDGDGWTTGPEGAEDRDLYALGYGGRPWTIRRNAAYWSARFGWLQAEGWRLLIRDDLDGYCWVKTDEGGSRVDEAVGACAQRIRQSAPGPGSWRCRLPLGESPELREAPKAAAVAMVRPLTAGMTLSAFTAAGAIGWWTDAF